MNRQFAKSFATKIALLALILLALPIANAEVLGNISSDKSSLAKDEIATVRVALFNDSQIDATNVQVRLEAGAGLVVLSDGGEQQVAGKTIENIPSGGKKEVSFTVKCTSTQKDASGVYSYYGAQGINNALVTTIQTKEVPVAIIATAEKQTINGAEKIVVDFKLTNYYEQPIYRASAAVTPPSGFYLDQPVYSVELVQPNATIENKFTITPPPNANGEQVIKLNYEFFDSNTQHDFEKQFTLDYQRTNYEFIALIGLIVIVAGVYLFFKRNPESQANGTGSDNKK